MTGQPYDEDDAEFEAFLQGKGPLAQGLAELKQPEPSAALDAAILAQVAADLERDAAAAQPAPGVAAGASAANDDTGPADFRPYRWRERWRMPLALAAGITAIAIALPLWQDEAAYQQQAVNAQMQEIQIPAMPAAEPAAAPETPAPAKDAAAPAAAQQPAPVAGQAQAEAARRGAAAEKRKADSDDMVRKAMERTQQATPQLDAAPLREHASGMAAAPAASPAPPPPPQAPAPSVRLSVPAAAAPGVPSSEAPAPVVAKPVPTHRLADEAEGQPLYPPAMLARIEQLLKEGRRDEALAELDRLRTAYPDYPVPEKLREALRR
ncbi:hypothetical protein GJ700_19800 [Duganella sp. FT92W]|uniref:Uncharacterized protein n=1 Tax=Pseudoduganella rivuli TaxID=2666085 RepID=A0A7X2IPW8_9BURK|nr:hypothetical protein [Pseudoduganella rivuli]MRV73956.1 hypothetical protein [Pseudoduganella rivuli]